MAGRVLTIKCQCGRESSKWAWHVVQHGEKWASLPLRKPVKGFYCYGCKSRAPVILLAGGPWD